MSRKIIHLTAWGSNKPLAIAADHIIALRDIEAFDTKSQTCVYSANGSTEVLESYETVLRMWADALASED